MASFLGNCSAVKVVGDISQDRLKGQYSPWFLDLGFFYGG